MSMKLKDFNSSRFFVVVWGEGIVDQAVVEGFEAVIDYLDKEVNEGTEYTFRNCCAAIHDEDEWHHCEDMNTDDRRFKFVEDFGETVHLMVVRMFELNEAPQ